MLHRKLLKTSPQNTHQKFYQLWDFTCTLPNELFWSSSGGRHTFRALPTSVEAYNGASYDQKVSLSAGQVCASLHLSSSTGIIIEGQPPGFTQESNHGSSN